MFAGAQVPSLKFLRCNGQVLKTSVYPQLFSIIGYTYGGSGDDFKLPDYRGRVPVGFGDASSSLGCTLNIGALGGVKSNTLTSVNLPQHNHAVTGDIVIGTTSDSSNTDGGDGAVLGQTTDGGDVVYANSSNINGNLGGVSHNLTTSNVGNTNPSPIDNMQPYLATPFIIQVYP
jgi:microcystin-dependent protein